MLGQRIHEVYQSPESIKEEIEEQQKREEQEVARLKATPQFRMEVGR